MQSAIRDIFIFVHVGSAFLTVAFPIVVLCEALIFRSEIKIEIITVKRFNFFSKKSSIAGRFTYLMPITGAVLVVVSKLQPNLDWLYVSIVCWVASAVIMELMLFRNWTSVSKIINKYSNYFQILEAQEGSTASGFYAEGTCLKQVELQQVESDMHALNVLKHQLDLIIYSCSIIIALLFTVLYLMVRHP